MTPCTPETATPGPAPPGTNPSPPVWSRCDTFAGSTASDLSWILNAYTIVFAALLIPAGKLADRVGHRQVFLVGSTLFTTASMACGLTPTAGLLTGFRMMQAAGAAALIPASLALVMHAYTRDQLPRAVAIWGVSGAVAGALGPTLGAAIVEGLGWRWAFFINLPVGVYTVIAGRRNLQESSDPHTQVPSPLGVALVATAAGLLSYGVVNSGQLGLGSPRTIATIGAGLITLAIFVAHQRQADAPALNLELFQIRNFAWGNLAILVFGTVFSALFFGSILFLTEVWGWSVFRAGSGVAPGPIMVGLVTPSIGRLAGRIGQRPILLAGGVLFAGSGLFRLVFLTSEANYLRDYFPSMVLSGLGVACVFPQLSSVPGPGTPRESPRRWRRRAAGRTAVRRNPRGGPDHRHIRRTRHRRPARRLQPSLVADRPGRGAHLDPGVAHAHSPGAIHPSDAPGTGHGQPLTT